MSPKHSLGGLRFIASLLLVLGGAAALWMVRFRPQLPDLTQAQESLPSFDQDSVGSTIQNIDGQVASLIRQASQGQLPFPQLEFENALSTTVSATISTSPEELMKQLREQGAQAALGTVAKSLELQAGNISSNVVNEARYQYCKGVVEAFEQSGSSQ